MATTITGKVIIDAADALRNIGDVAKGFASIPKDVSVPIDVDSAAAVSGLGSIGAAAQQAGTEVNNALSGAGAQFTAEMNSANAALETAKANYAALVASGQQGTPAFQAAEAALKSSASESRRLASAVAEAEKAAQPTLSIFQKIKGAISEAGNAAGTFAGVFGGSVLTAGLSGLVSSVSEFVGLSKIQEQAEAKVEAAIKSTGGAAGVTADEIKKMASGFQNVTTFGDEATLQGQAMLLTFTNIGKDVFPAATETMLNMSAAMGTDLKGSAIQLGKALNDPTTGAAALRRVGVALTEQQEQQIKKFQESGDIVSAQKIILKELGTEFGGLAKAMAQTDSGKLEQISNRIGDVKEVVGKLISQFVLLFAPAIDVIVGGLETFTAATTAAFQYLRDNGETVKNVLIGIGVVAAAVGSVMLAQSLPAIVASTTAWIENAAAATAAGFSSSKSVQLIVNALGLQTSAQVEAAAVAAEQAAATAAQATAAETAALVNAEAAAEAVISAQAQAAAALEVVAAKEAELIAAQAVGGAEAETAAIALVAAETQAAAAFEVVASKQLEAASLAENAVALGVAAAAAEVEATATAEAALAADASAFSFGAMWAAITGPVGLAIAGIAAVGAGVYLLYKNVKPFQEVVDAAFSFIVEVGKQALDVLVDFGGLLFTVGKLIFQFLILPYQILFEVLKPIGTAIFDLASKFLGFGDAAKDSGKALDFITGIFDKIKDGIALAKAGIEGFTAAIASVAETAGKVITAITNLDFGGAWDAFTSGAEKAGEASAAAIEDSLRRANLEKLQENFSKGVEKAAEGIQAEIDIKAKVADIENIDNLQQTLVETQAKLPDLELKVRAGKATNEEKKEFDRLVKVASETSEKIAKAAPQATLGFKQITNSAGELVQVTEINTEKVKEYAEEQKKAFDKETQENVKKYSENLANAAEQLDAQKKKLVEVKAAQKAAEERGDTTSVEKLKSEADQLQAQIITNQAAVKKGFEDGARSGLLTASAADKVGTALGFAAGEGTKVAAELKGVAEQTAAAAFNAAKLAENYKKASDNAGKALDESKQQAAGIQFSVEELQKGRITLEQFNKDTGKTFATIAEAVSFASNERKKQLKEESKQELERQRLTRIGQQNDTTFLREQHVKQTEISLQATEREIDKVRARRERRAKETITDEKTLALELADIAAAAESLKADAAEEQARKSLATRIAFLTKAEIDAENEKINKIVSDREAKENEYLVKRNEIIGKANLKEYETAQKLEADKLKNAADFAQKTAELTAGRVSQSADQERLRLREALADKLFALQKQSALEISETISKNAAVIKAEENLKKAIESNNAELITSTTSALTEARTLALQTDPAVLAAQRKTTELIATEQKQSIRAVKDFEISQIADTAQRESAIKLAELDKTFTEEQAGARGNQQKIFEITRKYVIARQEIENAAIKDLQAAKTLSAAFEKGLLDGIAQSRKSGDTEAVRGQIKASEDKLKALEEGLLSGKITEEKYATESKKLNEELESAKRAQMSATFDFGSAGLSALGAVAAQAASIFKQATDTALTKYAEALDARKALADEEAKAAIELEKVKQEGIIEEIEKAEEKLQLARGNRQKNEEEAGKAITEVYANVALGTAAALGTVLASGKDAGKGMLKIAFDTLQALIPIITAQIFGITAASPANVATLGTWGVVEFGLLTAAFQGFVAIARSAAGLRYGGQPKDADGIEIPGVEGKFYKRDEDGEEFVVNRQTTLKNLPALQEINRRNITIQQFALEHYAIPAMLPPLPELPRQIPTFPAPLSQSPKLAGADTAQLERKVEEMSQKISDLTKELKNHQKRITINATTAVTGQLKVNKHELVADMRDARSREVLGG